MDRRYIEYNVAEASLRLAADDGSAWSAAARIGASAATLANSQCLPDVSRSTATVSGKNVVLKLAMRFNVGFAGKRILYIAAADAGDARLEPLAVGAYDLYVNAPPAVSVEPSQGSGLAQTFTLTASDPRYVSKVSGFTFILISRESRGRCGVSLSPAGRRAALGAEDGRSFGTLVQIAPGVSQQNSLCGLDVSAITFAQSAVSLIATIPVVMMPGTAGVWDIYPVAFNTDGLASDWKAAGAWTVPQNSCSYTLEPATLQTAGAQLRGTLNVKTGEGCPWIATSNASWIQLTSALRGTGSGTLDYTIAPNTGQPWSGSVAVMGQAFTVTQSR